MVSLTAKSSMICLHGLLTSTQITLRMISLCLASVGLIEASQSADFIVRSTSMEMVSSTGSSLTYGIAPKRVAKAYNYHGALLVPKHP